MGSLIRRGGDPLVKLACSPCCGTGPSSTHDARQKPRTSTQRANPAEPSPGLEPGQGFAQSSPRSGPPQRLYLEPRTKFQAKIRAVKLGVRCIRPGFAPESPSVGALTPPITSTSPSITGRPKLCRAPHTAHPAPSTGRRAPAVHHHLTALRLRDHGPKCPLPPAAALPRSAPDSPVDPDQIAQGPHPGHSRGQFSSVVDRQCPRVWGPAQPGSCCEVTLKLPAQPPHTSKSQALACWRVEIGPKIPRVPLRRCAPKHLEYHPAHPADPCSVGKPYGSPCGGHLWPLDEYHLLLHCSYTVRILGLVRLRHTPHATRATP